MLQGRKASALIAADAVALNGVLPTVIGAVTGLPVVYGDGMWRAFPEFQMSAVRVCGYPPFPS